MNLFFKDLAHLEYGDIKSFCDAAIPEGTRLDYKRQMSTPGEAQQRQVTKAVSAMANTQGGVVLYGVGTRRDAQGNNTTLPEWPSDGMLARADFDQQVTRWCIEHVHPPLVPAVGWVANPADCQKGFGVVRIEASRFTPHTVDGGTRIYVRRRDTSDPVDATFAEIELLRNQRERALAVETLHVHDLKRRTAFAPDNGGTGFHLLVTPDFSHEYAISLDDLPRVAHSLGNSGFDISAFRSYSHGLISSTPDGQRMAVTHRGSVAFVSLRTGDPDRPIYVTDLMQLALAAPIAVRILSKATGNWGTYGVEFVGIALNQFTIEDPEARVSHRCVDDDVRVSMEVPALVARNDLLAPAVLLLRRFLWAFDLHKRTWPEELARKRLRAHLSETGQLAFAEEADNGQEP